MASSVDVRGGVSMQNLPSRDYSTAVPIGVDYAHHEVHAGKHFFIAQGYNLPTSGNVRTVFFLTGNDGSLCHMLPSITVNGPGTFRLIEAPSNSVSPATVPLNNRRPSANVSAATWSTSTSALTTDGSSVVLANLILGKSSGGGANTTVIGGNAGSREELILKANTLYGMDFTSAGDDVDVNFILEWYEHTDKA